jgi:hypothetical protein
MADDTEDQATVERPKHFFQSLSEAHLPLITLCALFIAAIYAGLVIAVAAAHDWNFSVLGQFGDSFGALTSIFNALAFAALIATVVLQSRELQLTRTELTKQAKAQSELAKATADQLKQTQDIESIRVRPFLKAEWERVGHNIVFWMRNVGGGVAIVRSIELRARRTTKDFYGSVKSHNYATTRARWRECILDILGGSPEVEVLQFNDLNRTLAPGETQQLIRVYAPAYVGSDDDVATLRGRFRPEITFESVNGDLFSTATQVKSHHLRFEVDPDDLESTD